MTSTRTRPLGALTPVVDATAGVASALTFGALSALRRARVFHPDGLAFQATLDLHGADLGVPLLDEEARRRCIVRASRGVGVPEPVPDVLGLAVRILDAHGPDEHQDLLTVTSGEAPGARHLILPSGGWAEGHFSTVLPYRVGGRLSLFGLRPVLGDGTSSPRRLRELADAVADARVRFELEVATPTGPWQPVGTLEIGRRLSESESEALTFNPFHTGGGIEPVGVLQTLRRRAYAGSQTGRAA